MGQFVHQLLHILGLSSDLQLEKSLPTKHAAYNYCTIKMKYKLKYPQYSYNT